MGGAIRFLMLLTVTPTPSPFLHHRYASLLRLSRHRPPLRSSVSCLSHRHLPSSISPSHSCPSKIKASHQLHTQTASIHFTDPSSSSLPLASHPWPEWSNFINNLWAAGYFNRQRFSINLDEEFVAGVNLPEDFVAAASACLAYARERPDLLGMLSRRDIEVVVERGMPFLFKNGDDSVRRMRLFLDSGYSNVQSNERAHTVDLMRFLLSYASNCVSSGRNNPSNGELVESSVLNVLNELAQLSNAPETNLSGSVQNQFPDRYGQALRHIGAPQKNPYGSVQNQSLDRYGQAARPVGQNIEMKRGDWICPRCSFMNFARNMKCLECEEARPKRQLTGGEWECPQCDFFNYGRNTVCLRCDCKRPGEVSLTTNNSGSGLGYDYGSSANKAAVDSRLAANEEKAQRWFSKISQLDSNSDMSSAIEDEDFPEIMPLRKGVNRFVVSTRKTPLERRLANAQDRRNLANDGTSESSSPNMKPDQTVNQSLQNAGANTTHSASNITSSHAAPSGSNFIPFVPLPADMFANIPDKSKIDENEAVEMDNKSLASITDDQRGVFSGNNGYGKSSDSWQPSEKPPSNEREKEQAEKSERWFKRAAELHNVTDLASAISDEDFPEIMPMQKGENRFVVSKRKDRSLTSPMYKRRMAMEQANDTNFVPFVPFPPNYFAQKDKQQPDEADLTDNTLSETSNSAALENIQQLDDSGPGVSVAAHDQGKQNRKYSEGSIGSRTLENSNKSKAGASSISENSTQNVVDLQPSGRDSWSSGYSRTRSDNFSETPNMVENSSQNFTETSRSGKESRSNGFSAKEETSGGTSFTGTTSENQNVRGSWSGKSLEGSAVKEPDPLDMSEEAKAERWFRRVAQIKDISELSQIPDEDFPSIMPMRKGVNRFVVSKRKTPLERRLTSTQYRRNLPIVNSDPVKENDTADES